MSEIIEFRRRRNNGRFIGESIPKLRLTLPRGEIVLYKTTLELLDAKVGDAVMFGFNKSDKMGFIYKENPEPDSYYLTETQYPYARFTSKQLAYFIVDIFELDTSKNNHYFKVEKLPNNKVKFYQDE